MLPEFCSWNAHELHNVCIISILKFFSPQILGCRQDGNHPQEELAKFAHKLERKENLRILLYSGNLLSKYGDFSLNSQEIWRLWHFLSPSNLIAWQFFHQNALYESHCISFGHQFMKICSPKKPTDYNPHCSLAQCEWFELFFLISFGISRRGEKLITCIILRNNIQFHLVPLIRSIADFIARAGNIVDDFLLLTLKQ
jgi:hypothetical protein